MGYKRGASARADRADGPNGPEPATQSQPKALIPCAEVITVSPEAFAIIQAAIANPPEPTEALKRLMRRGAEL